MTIKVLNAKLLTAYSQETAQPHDRLWSPNNPTKGHCAIVAMIVQDFYGGKIMRCLVDSPAPVVHYFNDTNKGYIDLTWDQFDEDCVKYSIREARGDEYLFNDTLVKYALLKERAGV